MERRLEHCVFEIARELAGVTGDAFARSLVRLLASTLPAHHVLLGSLIPGGRIRTLAAYADGKEAASFEYGLSETPCANVLAYQVCSYPRDVQRLFPSDQLLGDIGAAGYVGCAVNDSAGQCMGILVALTRDPLPEPKLAEALLQIFSIWAGAELERQRYDQALISSERRLREFTTNTCEGIARIEFHPPVDLSARMSEDELIDCLYQYGVVADCNEQAAALFGMGSREGLIGAPLEAVNPRSAPDALDRMRAAIRSGFTFSEVERKLGDRALLVTRRGVVHDRHLHAAWVTLRDVTDLKSAEAEIRRLNGELEQRVAELSHLKSKLEQDNAYLLEELRQQHNSLEMIGSSAALGEVIQRIRLAAPTAATVLIQGESGTGKELVARAIHNLSPRRGRPLVKINCGAIPPNLAESELFGHVKGAFTGASERRLGRFEYADGGTLFLDEITELPLETQSKLLRVLQEQEFEPVGSNRTVKVDVRVIAATNRKLDAAVVEGRFRMDLYYRLQVFPIDVPPLRERREDLPALAAHFLDRLSRQLGKRITGIAEESMQRMLDYHWPGNIRELENMLARAMILAPGQVLVLPPLEPLAPPLVEPRMASHSLKDAERTHVEEALRSANWVIEGHHGAARLLNVNPSTLRSLMKRLGIRRPAQAATTRGS